MTIAFSSLIVKEGAEKILARGLEVARVVGLQVSSWRAGDPTRSLYKYLAEVLTVYEDQVVEFTKAGMLSQASGDWLTVHAEEVYGVARVAASYATAKVTLSNTGGGYYEIDAGDVTLRNPTTNATFHCTSGGVLGPGGTLILDVVADTAGASATSAANEISALVTTLLGVVVVSSTAAVGVDEQSDAELREQCRATLGALSPAGPAEAYEYVARNSALTGVSDITRARAVGATTGAVSIYLASPSGAVAGASVIAAQTAIETWATPLCVTPTALNATPVTVHVTATVEGVGVPASYATDITSYLGAWLAGRPISDGTGFIARSQIIAKIHEAVPAIDRVTLSVPAADVTLTLGQVPVIGTVTVGLV